MASRPSIKVGLALQLAPGVEDLIRSLIGEGKKVLLDYKDYDISERLKKAVGRAASLGYRSSPSTDPAI